MNIENSSSINVYNNVLYNLTTANMSIVVSKSCLDLINKNNEVRSSL